MFQKEHTPENIEPLVEYFSSYPRSQRPVGSDGVIHPTPMKMHRTGPLFPSDIWNFTQWKFPNQQYTCSDWIPITRGRIFIPASGALTMITMMFRSLLFWFPYGQSRVGFIWVGFSQCFCCPGGFIPNYSQYNWNIFYQILLYYLFLFKLVYLSYDMFTV